MSLEVLELLTQRGAPKQAPLSCFLGSPSSPKKRPESSQSWQRVTERLHRDGVRRKELAEVRLRLAPLVWDDWKLGEIATTATPSTSASTRLQELKEDLNVKAIQVLPEDPVEAIWPSIMHLNLGALVGKA